MSSFAWLDFSESDRRNALDVIDLFREQGTVDELGIGTVRDGIADLLFPGTSTIMTRARYYLFVPWMYRKLEARKVASNQIAQVARKEELALVEVLAKSDDLNGVIGIQARSRLRRLPSTIYWAGLAQLGIRRNGTAIDGYHRSLDSFYALGGTVIRGDDGHAVSNSSRPRQSIFVSASHSPRRRACSRFWSICHRPMDSMPDFRGNIRDMHRCLRRIARNSTTRGTSRSQCMALQCCIT